MSYSSLSYYSLFYRIYQNFSLLNNLDSLFNVYDGFDDVYGLLFFRQIKSILDVLFICLNDDDDGYDDDDVTGDGFDTWGEINTISTYPLF